MVEGWDTLREMLTATDFTEFEKDEAIIVKMVGESPTKAFMYVRPCNIQEGFASPNTTTITTTLFLTRYARHLFGGCRLNEHAKARAVERGVMAADTAWDAQWNELYKACAFRALFQPSPALADMYCRMLDDGQGNGDEAPRAHSSVGIHVRTGEFWRVGRNSKNVTCACLPVPPSAPTDRIHSPTHTPRPAPPGDDRTWNPPHSEPTDEHMRFADCADGIRRAAQEGGLVGKDGGNKGGRAVDLDRWHVASDYQKVVDDVRAKYPDYVRSLDSLEE